jgi:hypothetical protein
MSVKCLQAYIRFCKGLNCEATWEGLSKWKQLWKNCGRV